MKTLTTSEKSYTVSYFKPGQKDGYGISVSVTGDQKKKALKEARELLVQAQETAIDVYNQYHTADKGE